MTEMERETRESIEPDVIPLQVIAQRLQVALRTVYREIEAKRFPRPRQISAGRVGILRTEYERWLQERPVASEDK